MVGKFKQWSMIFPTIFSSHQQSCASSDSPKLSSITRCDSTPVWSQIGIWILGKYYTLALAWATNILVTTSDSSSRLTIDSRGFVWSEDQQSLRRLRLLTEVHSKKRSWSIKDQMRDKLPILTTYIWGTVHCPPLIASKTP